MVYVLIIFLRETYSSDGFVVLRSTNLSKVIYRYDISTSCRLSIGRYVVGDICHVFVTGKCNALNLLDSASEPKTVENK